ncbi:PAS domain S-box-containing protein [Streptomyces puniciscabiei]|uniref:protein-serine/threonine phosphatase n=1 Tax=Streptomyces puniciscabiei TaxID=164348 RepID=A0A542UJ59_9ACTN|nr:SpoIIE family protein phosphatase [Streptomyces puniciscabiei]TQK99105.1 PAS domain S-box-containing protein [Streptomyces puniciscabiei]
MSPTDPLLPAASQAAPTAPPGGLLDVLNVAAVVLDADGRIVLWSPQAEELFGYTLDEALGQYAGRLLVHEEHLDQVIELFAQVMGGGGSWAGVFPIRHKDGSTKLVEFRNMRLMNDRKDLYALGLASDQATLRRVERDLALSTGLVSQSPIGLVVMDTDLRYVAVNPAVERIDRLSAAELVGRHVHDVLPDLDTETIEDSMRQVLSTGVPILDQEIVGRTPADPDHDHAWSVSYYRLEDPGGKVLGVAKSIVDATDRHRMAAEAHHARRRLALIADASVLIGTTLDLNQTAQELANIVVPDLADIAAVDVLDTFLTNRSPPRPGAPAPFRALAVKAAYTTAVDAADAVGELARYDADRLVSQCVTCAEPVLIGHVENSDLPRIARSPQAATILARAGLHSYLVVPLIARGNVIGALDLKRIRNPLPFDEDDMVLAGELATRAAVSMDNACWYQRERGAALTLQRSLLPQDPPRHPGLEIAHRYQPAAATSEVGGDWFDVIPLPRDRTALVIGDVMGSGLNAAATMGQLRNAIRALADLDLDPARLLHHLDRSSTGLDQAIATCVYVTYNPRRGQCRISTAGHLPPVLVRPGRAPELLDLPTGVPLGVGGVAFHTTRLRLHPGDQLVLYTDGLVETRDQPIDRRLGKLLELLARPQLSLARTCDLLLGALRQAEHTDDDVALLIARARSSAD